LSDCGIGTGKKRDGRGTPKKRDGMLWTRYLIVDGKNICQNVNCEGRDVGRNGKED